jgi:hypothetical protein
LERKDTEKDAELECCALKVLSSHLQRLISYLFNTNNTLHYLPHDTALRIKREYVQALKF